MDDQLTRADDMMAPGERADASRSVAAAIRAALGCARSTCACHRATGNVHRPAHEDEHPSLSVAAGVEGRILVRCHAGCAQGQVITALKARGLWPDRQRSRPDHRITDYQIRTRTGEVVAIHQRIESPEGKRFVWKAADGQPGLGGLKTADLPLYGIEALPAAAEYVIMTEGEKARDALATAGYPAVGTVTGASAIPSDAVLRELLGQIASALRQCPYWRTSEQHEREVRREVYKALLAAGVAEPVAFADKLLQSLRGVQR